MLEAQGEHQAIADAVAAGDAEEARARTEALVLTLGRFALETPTPVLTPA
jgi:DNA-binding GntR family transcriptional regulator